MIPEIPVLYQDNDVIVVHKPVGLLTAPAPSGEISLQDILSEQSGKPNSVVAVTRLDRGVGGVCVLSRHAKAASFLSRTVSDHARFVKEYLAVVCGAPHEREGHLQDLLWHDAKRNKTFVVKRMRGGVKEASLSYRVLETVTVNEKIYALIAVTLHTGRTHQIRVQFASRHLALFGDGKYGGGDNRCAHPALYAHRLTFPAPCGKTVVCTAEVPQQIPWIWFESLNDQEREKENGI